MDPITFRGDDWDMPPTRRQHDRMVAKAGRPLTVRPQHYGRIGAQAEGATSFAPKGVRARWRSLAA